MAAPDSGLHAGLRAAFLLLASMLFTTLAWGQSASNGGALYTAHCSGCHTTPQSPYPAQQNGASAPLVIKAAITAGMTAAWTTDPQYSSDVADIAAFITSGNPPTQPVSTPTTNNVNVTFNTAQGFTMPAVVISPNYLAGGYAILTSIQVVTPPTKGNVVFSGQNATYTPNTNQFGPDSFTWRATNGSVSTSLRTTTISISNPPAPTLTGGTITGATGTPITTFVISASPFASSCSVFSGTLPAGLALGYNGTDCTISGTPTATASGTTVQIKGTNAGGTGGAATFTFNISLGLPAITSGTPPAGQELVSYTGSYTVTASNGPISSYGATGLPAGLSIVAATGQIIGTPSFTNGSYPITYPVTFTATNATGTGPGTVRNLVINKPVPQLSGGVPPGGQTFVTYPGYTVTAVPGPITGFNASGLPPGLGINASGVINGIPTAQGTFAGTVTATNSAGTSSTFPVSITITLGPPTVTSATTASAGEAQSFSYQITANNGPPFTGYGLTGTLPAGLTFDAVNGTITGTPLAGSGSAAGTHYPVTITASNATGTSAGAPLDIVVSAQAPVVTSTSPATGQTGASFNYQITANFAPTSFAVGCPTVAAGAGSLPAGLVFNATSGVISGTPTAVGSTACQMQASNGSGPSAAVALTINIALGPPVVTSAGSAGGAVGFPMSYQITGSNSPTSFGSSGLPPGLAMNASGLISGTPTTNGTFTATVSVTNGTGTGTKSVVFTIAVGIPAITSATTAASATGYPFSYQIVATNGPTSYAASGLPAGVTLNPSTGLISGSFGTAGSFVIGLTATNATGSGTATLTVNVTQTAAGLSSPTTAAAAVGQVFNYALTIVNGPALINVRGLPPGLAYNPSALTIGGIPTQGGTFNVTIDVINSAATVTSTLVITVAYAAPTAQDSALDVAYETPTPVPLALGGQVLSLTITAQPTHGLLTINGLQVTYTPANGYSGADSFAYTAANPGGTTAVATVSINVGTLAPVASAMAMRCDINTSCSADLTRFVKGSSLSGVSVGTQPAHGQVGVNGMVVTYTPKTDYFGADTFTYVAYGNAGKSSPATITVTVVGRPDPTKDANVRGLVDAQAQAARRFSAAQVNNFQRRMETLHRPPPPVAPVEAQPPETTPTSGAAPASGSSPSSPKAPTSANDKGTASASVLGLMPGSLVAPFVSAATSRSFDLNAGTGSEGGRAGPFGVNAWIVGAAQFGRRNETADQTSLRFTTDGLSIGLDKRFGDRLVLGLGFGYGQDETRVGSDGSRSKVRGQSFALYGSFQPGGATFVDVLAGIGKLDYDTRRHVAALDEIATGSRRGDQSFASIAAGIELRRDGVLVSPYARLDATSDKLRSYDEHGVGDYALHFDDMRVRSTQVAAGLRIETQHDADFGSVVPRLRAEYRRELQDEARATLRYADLLDGPLYTVSSTGTSRNSLLLGVGSDFVVRGGLRLGVDYVAQRANGAANVQGVRILASLDLDRPGSPFAWQPRMFKDPIGVEAGYSYDDNVTRGRVAGEKLADSIFSLAVGEPIPLRFASLPHVRVMVTPQFTGEKFRLYQGLGRASAGAQAELQYRGSGAFDAMTYGLVVRGSYDEFESSLRRGGRYFAGVNARRSLTDRIDLFAEAGRQWRDGRSEVFQTREWIGKVNLDYGLGGKRGILYLAGEYRHGDSISSGPSSLVNVGLADVLVPDDAFPGLDFFAYRFDARTGIGTVGWNYPLGPRDSLDLSFRRVQSSPTGRTVWDSGTLRYIDNQYSIVYLMRF